MIVRSIFLLFILGIISFTGLGEPPPGNKADDHSMPARDDYFERPAEGVIRILTYNIRNCIGMDGKTDFERVADVIDRINPHIVALQEVDSVTYRMNGIDVLQVLAEKTNMVHSYGPAIDFQGGKYGNGVLSRDKPLSAEYIPLPGRQERRSLLMVEFKGYIIYCTHLNNGFAGERHGSVMIIDYEARNAEKPVFLAGDINDTPGNTGIHQALFRFNDTGSWGNWLSLKYSSLPGGLFCRQWWKNICIDPYSLTIFYKQFA